MYASSAFTSLRTYLCLVAIAAVAVAVTVTALTGEANASTAGGIGSGPAGATKSAATKRAGTKYVRLWRSFSVRDRRWARNTSQCESGSNPRAIGGGGTYRGAFQFMISTWNNSPQSPGGDPIRFSYRTQAVVAVLLKKRVGSSPWPVCG